MPMATIKELAQHPSLPSIRGKHGDFALRFRMALQYSGLMGYDEEKGRKFGSFAKIEAKPGIPYKRAFIGQLYRGDSLPEPDKFDALAKVMGVDSVWLRTGVGEMVAGGDYNRLIAMLPEELRRAVDNIIEPYREKSRGRRKNGTRKV